MRFVGRSRLGFYPLPLSEAQRICRFLLFPVQPSSALDPCVGDGVAFEGITSDAEVFRYGVELDVYRAEQARQRIPNIVHPSAALLRQPRKESPPNPRSAFGARYAVRRARERTSSTGLPWPALG